MKAFPLTVAMLALGASIAFGFYLVVETRETAAEAACANQREFRAFMTDYLADQIGQPISDVQGFEELAPELQAVVLQLEPVLKAEREADQQALAEYIATFPIPNCD